MNEYYRTKDGIIGKYIMQLKGDGITDYGWRVFDVDILWYEGEWTDRIPEDCWDDFCNNDVVAISLNLIDLIEAGDYVNNCRVVEHAYQKGRLFVTDVYIGGKVITTSEDYSWELTKDREDWIKSIVTKEQFENISYKVEKE